MKKPTLTFEEHQQLASHLLTILDEIDWISTTLIQRPNVDRKTCRISLVVGRAAMQLQMRLEQELSNLDGHDKRSWALYYPQDRPGAHVLYAASMRITPDKPRRRDP